MSKLRTVTKYIFVIVTAAAILLMAVALVAGINIYRVRPDRKTASVWGQGSGMGCSHVALYARGARQSGLSSPLAYIDDGTSLSLDDINSIRLSLQGGVDLVLGNRRATKDKIEKPEGWADCYSSGLKGSVTAVRAGSEGSFDADIYAVSGSFTAMHPFEFMSGGFLSPDTTDKYQVVLNDALAWKIYSSYDVIGEKVKILDKDYSVIGVVREHEDKEPRAYIAFDCLEEYCSSLEDPVAPAVMTYEAILPEQSKGSARFDLCNAIPGYNMSSPSYRVVSVTGRYNVFNTFKEDATAGYELPFWEEGALKAESDIKTAAIVFSFGLVMLAGLAIGRVSSMLDSKYEE
ncbi:MAG: ABC transporter permease [Clostridiales bacterium]|nr:ABC transporter permease [Clostridiales bacterium]